MNDTYKKKIKRGCNYTPSEKEILIDIVKGCIGIIENKSTTGEMIKQKQHAWQQVTKQFNSVATSGPRTWQQLRHLYENIKQRFKKNVSTKNNQQYYLKVLKMKSEDNSLHVFDNDDDIKDNENMDDVQNVQTIEPMIEITENFDESTNSEPGNGKVVKYDAACTLRDSQCPGTYICTANNAKTYVGRTLFCQCKCHTEDSIPANNTRGCYHKMLSLSLAPVLLFQRHSMSTQHDMKSEDRNLFQKVFPKVVDSALANPRIAEIPGLEEWMKKLLTHNMTGGKGARGLTVVMAYEMLANPEELTEESMKQARILGWCFEMFQSFMCIVDDMMDGSETRRGKPCWYLLPEVGTGCALNDSVILYNCMFYLLKKNFSDSKNYTEMYDAINETMFYSSFGQFLDHKTSEHRTKDYSLFTSQRYHSIIKYKTGFYTYDLPTRLGLLLADYNVDGHTRKLMQEVSLEIGLLFQIQDDYFDCFSDETLTGKVANDIQEGKCSWLAVNALQLSNAAQKVVFNAVYGSKEPAHVERCKQLYCDLKLPELYKQVKRRYYDDILERIQELPTEELRRLFNRLLEITYQRKK